MKVNKLISCILTLTLLLAVFGTASAMNARTTGSYTITAPTLVPTSVPTMVPTAIPTSLPTSPAPTFSLPNPIITSISGDQVFGTAFLPLLSLPGTTTLDNGMPAPIGFKKGEKQFEGVGLKVTGMDYGKAKVCFPITSVGQGWSGKVAMWTGSKWNFLPTTLSPQGENGYAQACADINGSGTYVLIKWVADPSKLPVTTKPSCGYDIDWAVGIGSGRPTELSDGSYSGFISEIWINSSMDLSGKQVTVSLFNSTPSGSMKWLGTASGSLVLDYDTVYSLTNFPYVPYTMKADTTGLNYLLDFGSCVQVVPNKVYKPE